MCPAPNYSSDKIHPPQSTGFEFCHQALDLLAASPLPNRIRQSNPPSGPASTLNYGPSDAFFLTSEHCRGNRDAGAEIVLASPKGGQPPLDPKSNEPNFQTDLTHRFEADPAAKAQLASTVRLDSVKADDYDTVFYPGGHGPMWDLAEDPNSIKLIESFLAAGKPVALVCHAPGALRHVKTADGKPLVEGKNVTGFTNSEEEAVGLTKVVPFLVEDELKAKGGHFSKTGDWGVHVVSDGLLITGQNPASSGPAAKVLLDRLAKPGKR
jgi:putative intracellular protease/amidase